MTALIFDKTGTLTTGKPLVVDLVCLDSSIPAEHFLHGSPQAPSRVAIRWAKRSGPARWARGSSCCLSRAS